MKKSSIFLIIFLIAILVTSGCTRPESTGVSEPVTPVLPALSPAISDTSDATPAPSPLATYRKVVPPQLTAVTETTTRIATDNPYLEYLQVRKKTFDYSIPNCPMAEAFPAIVNDSGYGIKQITPKLTMISEDEYETFLRKYTEGKAENTAIKTLQGCLGADGNPYWNFIETRVILNPTNFKPSDYIISTDVRSNGKIIAQFTTTKTLTIDQKVILTNYIPIKADEVNLFDDIGLTYTRLTR
ncbi:MAG: hypothetical protein Q7T80_16635 [Methanoregula sp.]|nr:hypothetical protein [Methanoregula sp.]